MRIRQLPAVALLVLAASSLRAQQPSACEGAAATYQMCALRWDRGRVYQGEADVRVARQGLFRPARLASLVQGDSALHYAAIYQKKTSRANAFMFLGTAMYVGALVMADSRDCEDVLFSDCDVDSGPIVLAFSGLSSTIIGAFLASSGIRAASKAVWWNNARYAR